jgi:enoyl-CoA hydratase/carnithine racemase
MYQCIEYQKKNKVAIIAIDQVQDNNRVNRETLSEMIDALHDAQADSAIAAIIITGKGDFFCTGGRMNGFPDGLTMDVKGFADAFSNLQMEIYKCSKPVIAAVNGNAVAGGFCIMESCDIAIVGKDCKFGLPELSRGNFPMLALAIVMKALPKKLVFELAYSSQLVDAETVKEWHLVNRVVDQDKVLDTGLLQRCGRLSGPRSLLQHGEHEPGAGCSVRQGPADYPADHRGRERSGLRHQAEPCPRL